MAARQHLICCRTGPEGYCLYHVRPYRAPQPVSSYHSSSLLSCESGIVWLAALAANFAALRAASRVRNFGETAPFVSHTHPSPRLTILKVPLFIDFISND